MAFSFIEKRLGKTIDNVKKRGTLTEEDIQSLFKEIRLILLEADVNLKVVKEFLNRVKEKSIGETINFSNSKSQELIKIINNELIKILGSEVKEWKAKTGDVVMMVGLQGAGKTTTTAKITNWLVNKKRFYKKPLLVGLDVYRPAAIEQLEKLSKDNGFDFYSEKKQKDVKKIIREAMSYAKFNGNDLIILDTAGRLQTNEKLMNELLMVKKESTPKEIIFVADGMAGQELINVAEEFNNKVGLTSAIITKLDSNAKGGAALSLAQMLNLNIGFIGTGEKVENFEQFHPDRMASRILGLGDIDTLVEKATEVIDESQNERMMRKMMSGQFDLIDLMESMEAMNKMGSMRSMTKLIPGMKALSQKSEENAEDKMKVFKILIDSMTQKEKRNPRLLKHPKRNARIIKGSGRHPKELNTLLRDFDKAKKQMKQMSQLMKSGRNPFGGNGFNSGGFSGMM